MLDQSGYSMQTSEIRSTVDEQGTPRAEFDVTYRNDQPGIAIIHAIITNTHARAAAAHEKYLGVSISESEQDRTARQQATSTAALQPRTGLIQEQTVEVATASRLVEASGVERRVLIRVDEVAPAQGARGQAEAVKEALGASGARVGEVLSTTDEQGVRHSEINVSYCTDQPELACVSQALDAVTSQPASQVVEHDSHRDERQERTHE